MLYNSKNIPQYLHTRLGKQGIINEGWIFIDGTESIKAYGSGYIVDDGLDITEEMKNTLREAAEMFFAYGIPISIAYQWGTDAEVPSATERYVSYVTDVYWDAGYLCFQLGRMKDDQILCFMVAFNVE